MTWWINEQIATHLTRTVSSRFALLIFANRMRQMLDKEIKDGYTRERIFACPSRSRCPPAFGTMRSNVGSYLAHLLSSGY